MAHTHKENALKSFVDLLYMAQMLRVQNFTKLQILNLLIV
jgi:hypothetical protein